MDDRFKLSREENVFLAKKAWDVSIYCGMKMENRNVTFPETVTILQGVNVPNVSLDDIQAILNMRDAWRKLLNTIDATLDIDYLCMLNNEVSRNESLEWGVLRSGTVGISGSDYKPPVPVKEVCIRELQGILDADASNTEKALNIFLWGCRTQLFWDGNKRTSLLAANKLLIKKGCGILTIAEQDIEEFNILLSDFYNNMGKNTAQEKLLKNFLYEKAIQGIEYNEQ
ncbi:MAG: Fic family protein [Spirochaetaceae bacterium]|jgi:hypothetical protein|nr:Fic family protein [Spirochaetaceae bacterium]